MDWIEIFNMAAIKGFSEKATNQTQVEKVIENMDQW